MNPYEELFDICSYYFFLFNTFSMRLVDIEFRIPRLISNHLRILWTEAVYVLVINHYINMYFSMMDIYFELFVIRLIDDWLDLESFFDFKWPFILK